MSNDNQQQLPNLLQEPERGIGERIRQRRKELDLTVEELAALTVKYDYASGKGVSAPTLYRYERDESLPGARELRILCWALDMQPNRLLLGLENEGTTDQQRDAKLGAAFRALMAHFLAEDSVGQSPFGKQNEWRSFEHQQKMIEAKRESKGKQ